MNAHFSKRRLGMLSFWLWARREPIGLLLAVLTGVIAFAGLAMIAIPRGPGEPASGVIVAMGYTETDDEIGHPIAEVRMQDRPVSIHLPPGSPCRIGDSIRLVRRPLLWGEAYGPALQPCAGRAGSKP